MTKTTSRSSIVSIPRFDLLFSYWIFAWYVLYMLNVVPYNPKLALILAVFENIGMLLMMIFYLHVPSNTVIGFLGINILVKVIPLYTVWNKRIHLHEDMSRLLYLFLFYLFWVYMAGYSFFEQQMKLVNNLKTGKTSITVTPGMQLLRDFLRWLT